MESGENVRCIFFWVFILLQFLVWHSTVVWCSVLFFDELQISTSGCYVFVLEKSFFNGNILVLMSFYYEYCRYRIYFAMESWFLQALYVRYLPMKSSLPSGILPPLLVWVEIMCDFDLSASFSLEVVLKWCSCLEIWSQLILGLVRARIRGL